MQYNLEVAPTPITKNGTMLGTPMPGGNMHSFTVYVSATDKNTGELQAGDYKVMADSAEGAVSKATLMLCYRAKILYHHKPNHTFIAKVGPYDADASVG